MDRRRDIPIGIDDFRKLRTHQRYYVDKTSFIRELWDDGAEVLLLPRPRRFGKTLNLSMLRYFFDQQGEDTSLLFEGLSVSHDASMMAEQGQYPVIYLDFKSLKCLDWNEALWGFRDLLFRTCQTFQPWIPVDQWVSFETLTDANSPVIRMQSSLLRLCEILHQVLGKPVIVLIDEYDSPVLEAWNHGYYEEMTTFLRGFLGALLKGNPYLKKAVLTGILRVAKESIFSDLNHLDVHSILSPQFSKQFGFTEHEVECILEDFSIIPEKRKELQEWYNGYLFGNELIYNPWSVLEYIKHQPPHPHPYWANTSGNVLVRQLILDDATGRVRYDVETLLQGEPLKQIPLNENIVLREIQVGDKREKRNEIWNFLTFSGYLKPTNLQWDDHRSCTVYDLIPPNREVHQFYTSTVQQWIEQQFSTTPLDDMLRALVQEDWDAFRKMLRDVIRDTLSFHDTGGPTPEKVYHAFVLGMLLNLPDYRVSSNRESGYGRYDVMLTPNDSGKPGFVLEFKKYDEDEKQSVETALAEAIEQIQTKEYAAQLRLERVSQITGVAIVMEGKQVWLETVAL